MGIIVSGCAQAPTLWMVRLRLQPTALPQLRRVLNSETCGVLTWPGRMVAAPIPMQWPLPCQLPGVASAWCQLWQRSNWLGQGPASSASCEWLMAISWFCRRMLMFCQAVGSFQRKWASFLGKSSWIPARSRAPFWIHPKSTWKTQWHSVTPVVAGRQPASTYWIWGSCRRSLSISCWDSWWKRIAQCARWTHGSWLWPRAYSPHCEVGIFSGTAYDMATEADGSHPFLTLAKSVLFCLTLFHVSETAWVVAANIDPPKLMTECQHQSV